MPEGRGRVKILSAASSPMIPSLLKGEGEARALVWPGMGAKTRSLHLITLPVDRETCELRHRSEAVYYVINGNVSASDRDTGVTHRVPEGGMILVEPGTGYVLSAHLGSAQVVGGPCPPDPGLYEGMERV